MMRLLFVVVVLAWLSGCASTRVSVPMKTRPVLAEQAAFAFNGRVATMHDGERTSAGVRWTHHDSEDEILLLAPLGQTKARIFSNGQAVSLEAEGRFYVASDAESLTEQVLGWHLPMSGMRYWVLGMPAKGSHADIERDSLGQISVMHQDGWEIRYQSYASDAPDSLPLRLVLLRDGMELKLLIDEWETTGY